MPDWTSLDLQTVRRPELWAARVLQVRRLRSGMPEYGFVEPVTGSFAEPTVSTVGPVTRRTYASWEDLLDAGWRPV